MLEKLLDRVFPHEDMPWGRRWRLFGKYNSPRTVTAGKWLTRGLPWFGNRGVYLHKMVAPDADRDLHDHPYRYGALILHGGYVEYVLTLVKGELKIIPKWRRPGEWVDGPPDKFQRIDYLTTGVSWSLFFAGRAAWMAHKAGAVHKWGFMTANGWVPWTEYHK
jgi:hypothetical protein